MGDKELFLSFCRHLSGLMKAGLSLGDSLSILAESADCGRKLCRLSGQIFSLMKKGFSFSSSVSVNGIIRVDENFSSLLAAAERAGNLCDMLSFVTDSEEDKRGFASKITAACIYPLLIGLFAAAGCLFLIHNCSLLGFKKAPEGAAFCLMLSVFFLACFFTAFFYAARKRNSTNPQLVFFNSLSFFLSSGFDLKSSLSLVSIAGGLKNASLCSVLLKKLSLGIPLSRAMQEERLFSSESLALIGLAEKSGRLADACRTIASRLATREKEGRQGFLRYGEPALLSAVGLYVLILAQNVILPFITNFQYF